VNTPGMVVPERAINRRAPFTEQYTPVSGAG
jgi:hypothetical protein